MLINQIDNVLQKDGEHCKAMEFQTVKTPKFYLTGTQLWVEMPVDIIRKVSEEQEECIKSLDDVRMQKQPKNTGVGKTSQPKAPNNIQSTSSAFQQIPQVTGEDHEASPILKERGWQEAITLAAEFQNSSRNPQQAKVVTVQQNVNGDTSSSAAAQSVTSKTQTGSYIEDRQNKRNQVLEQFIRVAKRKGEMTAAHENKIRESFRIRQEAEEKRLREEEKKRQMMLDKALAKKLKEDEEKQLRQVELEERERLWAQQALENKSRQQEKETQVTAEFKRLQNQLSEDLRQQMELNYQKKFQEMQQSTRRNQIEEIQKSFELSAGNPGKEAQETTTHPELLNCWRSRPQEERMHSNFVLYRLG